MKLRVEPPNSVAVPCATDLAALPPASYAVARRRRYRDWDYTDIEADADSSRIKRILRRSETWSEA